MENASISQLRKKPHTQNQVARHPVLLNLKYDSEQVKLLIQFGIDAGIRICARVDIVTPNGLNVSEDFSLSPGQITEVWQNKPNVIQINLKPPQNLAQYLPPVIVANVGIEGLLIDKISADYYLSLTQEKPNSDTVNQDEPAPKKLNFREDAISHAVLKHIFPQILPDKSDTFTNVMKWDCFLQLEKSLKKDGAKNIIVYIESNKEHSTINGIACDREEINITYKAFKERLKKLLQFYKSS